MARNEKNMTVAEYARQQGCTMGYVYQQLWSGRLRARKVDGVWRIEALLRQRRAQTAAPKASGGFAQVSA